MSGGVGGRRFEPVPDPINNHVDPRLCSMNFQTGIIPESRAPLKTSFLRHHNGVGAFVAGDRSVPAPVGFGLLMVSRGALEGISY